MPLGWAAGGCHAETASASIAAASTIWQVPNCPLGAEQLQLYYSTASTSNTSNTSQHNAAGWLEESSTTLQTGGSECTSMLCCELGQLLGSSWCL